MKNHMLLVLFILGSSALASASLTECKIKKVEVDNTGVKKVTSCSVKINPKNFKGSPGNGGISHIKSIGTLTSDCTSFPSDYDFKTKKIKPFQVWEQGPVSESDIDNLFDYMKEMDYQSNVDVGFTRSDVSSMILYQGGYSTLVSSFYVARDRAGNDIGTILLTGGNPFLSFQGCDTK